MALIVLAMFTVLGIAHIRAANSCLVETENLSHVHRARQQAESGLVYFTFLLTGVEIPTGITGQELVTYLADELPAPLDAEISADGPGRGFTATLSAVDTVVTLSVSGRESQVRRTVSMDFNLVPGKIFGYAVASAGHFKIGGSSRIQGANSPSEADVLSVTYETNRAFTLTNSAAIEGDVYATNPEANVNVSGNATIGGEDRHSEDILDHIHIGIRDVAFPEVAPAVFESFATNIVDGDTPTDGDTTFTNIRIAAGTDPDFSGDTTINGVIFIETPNKVEFSGKTTITGVIVTQDADGGSYRNNITFKDNMTLRGVNQLPDESQFAGLKALPGSFLLAPGFEVEFEDDFGAVYGAMAADCFRLKKNKGGTVHGPIICYSSEETKLQGTSILTFDRSGSSEVPSGFAKPMALEAVPSTYREH